MNLSQAIHLSLIALNCGAAIGHAFMAQAECLLCGSAVLMLLATYPKAR